MYTTLSHYVEQIVDLKGAIASRKNHAIIYFTFESARTKKKIAKTTKSLIESAFTGTDLISPSVFCILMQLCTL